MSRRSRRGFAILAAVLVLLALSAVLAFRTAVGRPSENPEDLSPLSPGARALVEAAVAEFRANPAIDFPRVPEARHARDRK